jgi:excisionase family DNA binding protein
MTDEQQTETDGLVDTERAAKWLGIKPRTLDAYRKAGVIPHVRVGQKLVRFRLDDLRRYVNARLQTVENTPGESAA